MYCISVALGAENQQRAWEAERGSGTERGDAENITRVTVMVGDGENKKESSGKLAASVKNPVCSPCQWEALTN